MSTMYAGLIACILSLIFIPCIIYIAVKRGWYDQVNDRKIHTGKIPRLGGVGIFYSFFCTLVIALWFSASFRAEFIRMWPLWLAMTVIHVSGLMDDFFDLRARLKFAIHALVAITVAAAGYRFHSIYIPGLGMYQFGWISWPLSVVWIIGVINAINMIDGMDGLSGGISIIAAFSFGLMLLGAGLHTQSLIAIALVGALAGYLFFNFPPAKIFMGDSGSTFLGFILAVLPLLDTQPAHGFWFWDGITILLLPIFDVFAAIIRRSKKGVSLMSPDRWHFHHKLLRLGLGTRSILAVAYVLCMGLGAVAISVDYVSPLTHFGFTLCAWLVLLGFFVVLHYVKERSLALEEKNE